MSNHNRALVWAEDRLDDLIQQLSELIAKNQRPAHEVVMDGKGVMAMLNNSKRNLATLREENILPYYKIRGKIFYKLSDVLAMIDSHRVQPSVGIRRGKL